MPLEQTHLFNFEEEPVKKTGPTSDVQPGVAAAGTMELFPLTVSDTVSGLKKNTRGRKKISEGSLTADLIDIPEDGILFQKKYYSIGLVAKMFKVNISLIRYWEKEFDILKPKKNGKGDRHFRPEDIINLKMIHHLLREKKYTIDGARDFLKNNNDANESFSVIEQLKKTQLFLNELKLSL